MELSKKIIKSKVHWCPELVSLTILVFAEVIKNEDAKKDHLVMQLIKMMLFSTKRFAIRKQKDQKESSEKSDDSNDKPKKEKIDPPRSIIYAKDSGSISSFVLKSGMFLLIKFRI